MQGCMKKSRFSTNIGLYLGTDARKKVVLNVNTTENVNETENVNDYNNVRLFILELFNCLRSEVRKCK